MRDDTQLLNNGLDSELDSYDTAEDIKRTDYIYMVSGNNLVISLNAELDHHLAEEMRQVIDDVIDKRGVTHIVFDFTKVDFMDSAGIGLIMGRYKKVMDNEHMRDYEVARAEIDEMMHYITGILALCIQGEDPATCEPEEEHHCGGDCSGCSGC